MVSRSLNAKYSQTNSQEYIAATLKLNWYRRFHVFAVASAIEIPLDTVVKKYLPVQLNQAKISKIYPHAESPSSPGPRNERDRFDLARCLKILKNVSTRATPLLSLSNALETWPKKWTTRELHRNNEIIDERQDGVSIALETVETKPWLNAAAQCSLSRTNSSRRESTQLEGISREFRIRCERDCTFIQRY